MAIAGVIERTSSITLARVLERIFDHEQPGWLKLKHRENGRTAEVKIDRGAVQDTVFGELKGDEAMKEIAQTYPWDYEFVSEDPTITTGRLPWQPGERRKPALKLAGAVKPMMLHQGEISAGFATKDPEESGNGAKPERKSAFMAARPAAPQRPAKEGKSAPEDKPVDVAEPAARPAGSKIVPAHSRRMRQWPDVAHLAAWVAEGDEYAVRFAKSADQALGTVEQHDWDYFAADSSSLMLWAAGIGDTLGYSAPVLAALVEPQRAAAYRRLEDGFAGIYSGPDTTVDTILGIP
jgi:hypothetical protein